MRLTCPNCGAQYEVDASLIPAKGRDVQCSSCGHTWFQLPEPAEPDEESLARADREHDPDVALAGDASATPPAPTAEEPPARPEREAPAPAPEAPDAAEEEARIRELVGSVNVEIEKTETVEIELAAPPETPRGPEAAEEQPTTRAEAAGTVPPSVAELLREEAERERRERERERASRQSDAAEGLVAEDIAERERRAEEARQRVEAAKEAEARAASRFPDLEELNATLGGEGAPEAVAAGAVAVRGGRNRYRAGFLLAIILFGGLFVIYLNAPNLAEAWPSLRGPLGAYVDAVNGIRQGLAGVAERLVATLTRLAGEG